MQSFGNIEKTQYQKLNSSFIYGQMYYVMYNNMNSCHTTYRSRLHLKLFSCAYCRFVILSYTQTIHVFNSIILENQKTKNVLCVKEREREWMK